ncbi:MAG: Fe-S cluster assembly protein SufD [Hyphomicrobiaceae bacterium]
MTTTLERTDAEEQLARQFAGVASELPGGGWVPEARRHAMEVFRREGLPHRRVEEWKYTDLRSRLAHAYPPASCASLRIDDRLLATLLGPELAGLDCIRIVLVNGRLAGRLDGGGALASDQLRIGCLAAMLGEAGSSHGWMQRHFAPTASGDNLDPVLALNTAFVTDGVVVHVADGFHPAMPIHIVSITDADEGAAVATRNLVKVGRGARAVVMESHIGLGAAADKRQATAVTQIAVEEAGELHHIQHLAGGADAVHLGRWDIDIGRDATYRGFQLSTGVGLARLESHVRFSGPDAKLDLSGLMLGRGRDHIDTTLVIDHTTTGCESRELFLAVLDDRARAVFQGKVVVAPEAQKTDGKQMARSLMLSEDAEFDSKPELEIYADDVACGHGSTAAELDPDMLFYLRSRGIPLDDARSMLIESFAAGALDKIEDETIREAARSLALGWLRVAEPKTRGTPR